MKQRGFTREEFNRGDKVCWKDGEVFNGIIVAQFRTFENQPMCVVLDIDKRYIVIAERQLHPLR